MSHKIWEIMGDPLVYIEPFGGSIACLLERPNPGKHEIVGEVDANIINFFTCVRDDAEGVWHHANLPTDEITLKIIDAKLKSHAHDLYTKVSQGIYDVEMAGLWLYRQCCGRKDGLNPTASIRSNAIYAHPDPITSLKNIAKRLSHVKFLVGSWDRTINRVFNDLRTSPKNTCIFIDPPYNKTVRKSKLYVHDDFDVSEEVGIWAMANEQYKICVAGLEGEHTFPG